MTFQLPQDYQEYLVKLLLVPSSRLSIPMLNETAMIQTPLEPSDSTSDRDSCGYEKPIHSLLSNSRKIDKNSKRGDRYSKISNELRIELIDAVMNKGEKLKHAARRLGINYSSAKSISQVFRKEGRLDKKSSKRNKAKNHHSEKISPDANFINQSNKTQKDELEAHEELFKLPSRLQESQIERAKALQPLVVPKLTLTELDNLASRLPRSDTMSTCSTNGLNFSRYCSGDVEAGQLDCKAEQPMTFFQLLATREHGNEILGRNSAFSKVSKQKSQNSAVNKPGIHIPEYQPISSHHDVIHQLQGNNLSYRLNELRNANNVLLQLRNQALLPIEAHQRMLREQQINYHIINSILEEKLSAIPALNNLGNQNIVAQKEIAESVEDGANIKIPPLRL